MVTSVFLVRHCSVNYQNKLSDLYINLSTAGKIQSTQLADSWKINIDKIYSSNLPRAIETVTPLAIKLNKKIIKLPGLKELEYNGNAQTFHKNIKTNIEFKYVGGESIDEANRRFLQCLTNVCLKNINKSIVISTHGTVMSEFMIREFNLSPDFFFDLSYPDVYEINFDGQKFDFVKRYFNYLPTNSESLK